MKKNPNYDIEINLSDLFYHLLARWRSIIIIALLGAVALCGYRFYKTRDTEANREAYDEQMEKYQHDVEAYERYDSMVDSYTSQLDALTLYQEKSLRMKIDPRNEWVARCDYFVELDKSVTEGFPDVISQDPTDELIAQYNSLFYDVAFDAEAEKLAGVEEKEYLSELTTWAISTETNSFSITIIGDDEQKVRDVLDYYMEKIEGSINESVNASTKHKLTDSNNMVFRRIDQTLVSDQKDVADRIINLRTAIAKARSDQELLTEPVEPVDFIQNRGFVKYAIIGIILGGFLSAVFYVVRYILLGRVRNEDDLQHIYGLAKYGTLPNTITRKPNGGIDKLIERRRGRHNKADKAVICEQIAGMVGKKYADKKVLIVSSIESEQIQELIEMLRSNLGSKVSISVAQGFIIKPDSVKKAGEADAVIVAEARNESKISDVNRMAEMLEISGSNVVGYIAL